MSFPQLGYPQFLGASHEVYGGERPASAREGGTEGGISSSATAAAVGSMLGMYGSPWAAHNYSAFLPYSGATDLALISQMVRVDSCSPKTEAGVNDRLPVLLVRLSSCLLENNAQYRIV